MANLLTTLLLTGPKLKTSSKLAPPYCYKHNREKVAYDGRLANCPDCRKEQYAAKKARMK